MESGPSFDLLWLSASTTHCWAIFVLRRGFRLASLAADFIFGYRSYGSPEHEFLSMGAISMHAIVYEHRLPTIGGGGMQLFSFCRDGWSIVGQSEFAVIAGNIPVCIGVTHSSIPVVGHALTSLYPPGSVDGAVDLLFILLQTLRFGSNAAIVVQNCFRCTA
jgi:hypothetical protein